jgi:hypothetical protein
MSVSKAMVTWKSIKNGFSGQTVQNGGIVVESLMSPGSRSGK